METTPETPLALPVEAAHSSAREKVLEHLFVGELLRCLWRRGIRNMEVLRAEVDMGGYDLVVEARVVPLPAQASTITPPRSEQSRIASATRATGLTVGCLAR